MAARTQRWLLTSLACFVACAVTIGIASEFYSPLTKDRAERILEQRYASKVSIQTFHASLFPPRAEAGHLVFRLHGRTDVPPFVSIEKLSIEAGGYLGLLRSPRRLTRVRLEGLRIQIPPREHKRPDRQKSPRESGGRSCGFCDS